MAFDAGGNGYFVTDIGVISYLEAADEWRAAIDDNILTDCGGRNEGADALDIAVHPSDGTCTSHSPTV